MAIIFKDSNSVEVDGINAGDIVSVLSNYSTRKAEILKAFQDFRKVETDTHSAAITKLTEDHAKALKDKDDAKQAALEAKQIETTQAIEAKQAAEQEKQDIFDLLGADPKIAEIKKQMQIDAADAAIAEAIKRKEELTKIPEEEVTL